jgi:hypothetical protein
MLLCSSADKPLSNIRISTYDAGSHTGVSGIDQKQHEIAGTNFPDANKRKAKGNRK